MWAGTLCGGPHCPQPASPDADLLSLPLQALAKSIRLASEFEHVSLVGEPVEKGSGQSFIAKDLSPVGKAQVGGHDRGYALVQSGAELKDQLRASGGEGDKAQLVQDDELMSERRGQDLGQTMFVLSQDQFIHQTGGGIETDAPTLTAGRECQAGRDMRFTKSRVADQDDRLRLVDIRTACQVEDTLLAQSGQAREIKVGQLFEYRESCALGAPLAQVLLTVEHFLLGQSKQEPVIAQVISCCILSKLGIVLRKGR